jgi:phage head maturation protease
MFAAIIRWILAALLYELSVVTRPAYDEAQVEARNWTSTAGGVLVPGHALNRWRP